MNINIGIVEIIAIIGAFGAFGAVTWKFGKWQQKVDGGLDQTMDSIKGINSGIIEILDRLPGSPIKSDSPLQLTEMGVEISREIGAKEWAESESTLLMEMAEGKDPFEIQAIAFDHAGSFEPPEELFKKMKASAYDKGLGLERVRRMLGVA